MKRYLLLILACLASTIVASAQYTTVFEEGMNGYSGYRIPAITKAADGTILAFAEARLNGKGDTGNIDLVMRRSADGGKTWGDVQTIWDDGENTCGNPVPIVIGKDGYIVLLATWNLGTDHEKQIEQMTSTDTRRAFVFYSHDNGKTWSKPAELTSTVKQPDWGWYATGPCRSIVKQRPPHKGRLIVPANYSVLEDGHPVSHSHIIYSDDNGATWHIGAKAQVRGNECTVAELSDGKLLLNMRRATGDDTVRFYALSKDAGETFSEQGRQSDLIEPRCQGSLLNLSKCNGKPSKTLFFSNPSDTKKRVNLSLSISKDDGKTWRHFVTVYKDNSAYSDIVQMDSHHIGVLFENGDANQTYRRISFCVVDIRK